MAVHASQCREQNFWLFAVGTARCSGTADQMSKYISPVAIKGGHAASYVPGGKTPTGLRRRAPRYSKKSRAVALAALERAHVVTGAARASSPLFVADDAGTPLIHTSLTPPTLVRWRSPSRLPKRLVAVIASPVDLRSNRKPTSKTTSTDLRLTSTHTLAPQDDSRDT